MTTPKKKPAAKAKRGPKPETLTISGGWKDAVKRALTRGKPPAEMPVKKTRKGKKNST